MKNEYTPGPWWYENETAQICANHPLDEQYIARIYDADSVHSEKLPQEANACLIAAAPELFEALEELYNAYLVMEQPRLYKALAEAKKLIAKIEGDE